MRTRFLYLSVIICETIKQNEGRPVGNSSYLVVAVSHGKVAGNADDFVEEHLVRFFSRPRRFVRHGRSARPNQMRGDVSELQRDSFGAQNFLKKQNNPNSTGNPLSLARSLFKLYLHEATFVGNNLHVK